jgi:hypothetical protein
MSFSKLRAAIAVVLILGFVATGATILFCCTAAGQGDKKPATEKPVEAAAKQEKEKESANKLPWGDAVEDVQARLRPKKVKWQAKEAAAFELELRNQGKRPWQGVATQHYCELQVDGKWYKYGANFPGSPLTALKPGPRADHWLDVSLGGQWYKSADEKEKPAEEDKPGGKGGPIVLAPGKHTIRLAYRLIDTRVGQGMQELRVQTNAVEIDIQAPAVTAESRDELLPPVRILAGGSAIDAELGHAAPFFVDFDGDGVKHLLVGQFGDGKLAIYRNSGTNKEPRFDKKEWFHAGAGIGRVPAS